MSYRIYNNNGVRGRIVTIHMAFKFCSRQKELAPKNAVGV